MDDLSNGWLRDAVASLADGPDEAAPRVRVRLGALDAEGVEALICELFEAAGRVVEATRSPSDRRRVALDVGVTDDAMSLSIRWRSRRRRASTAAWTVLSHDLSATSGASPFARLAAISRTCRMAARLHGEMRIWETSGGAPASAPELADRAFFDAYEHFLHLEFALPDKLIEGAALTPERVARAVAAFGPAEVSVASRRDGALND